MDDLIDDLIRSGYSHVYPVDHDFEEESHGFQTEYSTDIAVGRDKTGTPYRITRETTKKFGPGSGPPESTTGRVEISEADFVASISGKTRSDTDEYRKHLATRDAASARATAKREEAQKALSALRPQCARCKIPMKAKSGSRGAFWGCPRYPKCNATRDMGAEARRLYAAT